MLKGRCNSSWGWIWEGPLVLWHLGWTLKDGASLE